MCGSFNLSTIIHQYCITVLAVDWMLGKRDITKYEYMIQLKETMCFKLKQIQLPIKELDAIAEI